MLTMRSIATTTAITITRTMTINVVPEKNGDELELGALLDTVMTELLFSVTPL
jgi:hypothetical protein